MSMLNVSKYMVGNASYALLKQRTKWSLNCSILLMALCTLMVLMDQSGYAAINVGKHTICLVSAQITQNQQNYPFSVPFWNANSRRVMMPKVKQVMFKRVIVTVLVAKQKKGKPNPIRPEQRGKDGRRIGVRKAASSGLGKKEQKWTEEQINQCFVLWEQNNDLPPEQKRSKRQISIECGVPYTTVCEKLSERRGGGQKGKIAGGKQQGMVLDTGKSKRVIKRVIKQVIFRNVLTKTN